MFGRGDVSLRYVRTVLRGRCRFLKKDIFAAFQDVDRFFADVLSADVHLHFFRSDPCQAIRITEDEPGDFLGVFFETLNKVFLGISRTGEITGYVIEGWCIKHSVVWNCSCAVLRPLEDTSA